MRKQKQPQKLPSLRVQSNVLLTIILVSLFFAAGASLKITLDYARGSHNEENHRIYTQAASKLNTKFTSVTTLMAALSCQNDLQKALYTERLYRTSKDWDNMLKLLFRYSTLEKGIDAIVCMDMSGNSYVYLYYQQTQLYEEKLSEAFLNDGFSAPFTLNNKTMITISRPIYRANREQYSVDLTQDEKIGQCIIFMDMDAVKEELGWDDTDEKFHMFLLNEQGDLIWKTPDDTADMAEKIQAVQMDSSGKSEIIVYQNSTYNLDSQIIEGPQWTLIGFSSEPYWQGSMTRLIIGIIICWGISLVLMIVLSLFFRNNIAGFIAFLQENMHRAYGDRDYFMPNWKKREFNVVADKFNEMIRRIDRLTTRDLQIQERLYQQELEKQQFALKALQSQVNPHFMYNTLECIKSIGVCYGADEIRVICESLAYIMRYSINRAYVSTIAEELESVSCYLSIQNIRFGGRFHLQKEVPPELMPAGML